MLESLLDRATRAMDSAILWQLGTLDLPQPEHSDFPAIAVEPFWAASRVHSPEPVVITDEIRRRSHGTVREVDLEAPSSGPGVHPGSTKLMARAHLLESVSRPPIVIILHGFAIPNALYEEGQCHALTRRGASAVRLDNPWHLRRRARGQRSGEGFMTADPMRLLSSTRQAVEDAAAVVAWARQRSDHVAVLGTSLGGLVACLLATQVELDAVVAVAPFCNPSWTLLNNLPINLRRKLGVAGGKFGVWGRDRDVAREVLDQSLAPVICRNLTPVTPPQRITLVCPSNDLIVGPEPITDLAKRWKTDLWDLRHGHISVVHARGLSERIFVRLLREGESQPERSPIRLVS